NAIFTTYRMQAPDRLAYTTSAGGGEDVVVIGTRRWDRHTRGRWRRSSSMQLHMPGLFWGAHVINARVLGTGRLAGRTVDVVSFYDPQNRGWFTLWIDKRNLHTLKLILIAAAHFMHHRYSDFNQGSPIHPPAGSRSAIVFAKSGGDGSDGGAVAL